MPPVPLETKYHPSAVDLLLIKRLIAETSKQNLLQFLQHEFVNISKSHAERLIGKTNLIPRCLIIQLRRQNAHVIVQYLVNWCLPWVGESVSRFMLATSC